MKNLSFWAQSLDNESPDFIYRNGEELSNDEVRQQFVSEIYEFPGRKLESLPLGSSISIRYNDPKFVIETIPSQKDQANRPAPVLIYGEFPEKSSQLWVDNACKEIEEFVTDELKRTIDHNTLGSIRNWLIETLDEKKKKVEMRNQSLSLLIGFLLPLLIGLLIQSKSWKLTTVQIGGLIALNNILVMSLQIFSANKLNRRLK